MGVDIYDPWADAAEVKDELGVDLIDSPNANAYDAIIVAVAHREFTGEQIGSWKNSDAVVFDTKAHLPKEQVDARL